MPILTKAQNCLLSGQATLSDSTFHEGIMLQLLDDKGVKIIAFRTTDSLGTFKFNPVKNDYYKLNISQFGYMDTSILIHCNQEKIELATIKLTPLSITMPELSIIDKAILLKKSGDTTIFNTKMFETGNEQSVTDIIEKIPGFTVDGDKIRYQDKVLENILIEGMDISDKKHVQFTNSVHYESVKDIRLIENYSKNYQPNKDSADLGLAMDITLKENYKSKIQGTLELAGGYNNAYNAAASAIRIDKRNAFRIKGGYSNQNENIIAFDNEQFIKNIIYNTQFNNKHILLRQENPYELPESIPSNFSEVNTYYVQGTMDKRIGRNISWRSQLGYSATDGLQQMDRIRTFRSNMVSMETDIQNTIESRGFSFDNEIKIPFNSSTNLEIDIPISLQPRNDRRLENGILADLVWQNRTVNYRGKNFIAPVYKFHKTFKNELRLSIIGKYQYQTQSGAISIYSNDSIAGAFEYYPDADIYLTQQNQFLRTSRFHNQTQLKKKWEYLELQYNVTYDNNKEKISNRSELYEFEYPFEGSERLHFQSVANSVRAMYRRKKYSAGAHINYTFSRMDDGTENELKNFLRPGYFLMYKFSRMWSISTSYEVKIYQPTLLQTHPLLILKDQVTINTGGAGIRAFTERESFTMSVFRDFSASMEGISFNSSLSFSPKTREIQPLYRSDGFFQTQAFGSIDRGKEWRGTMSFSKTSRKWYTQLQVFASTSNTVQNDELISDKYMMNTVRLEYKGWHRWKLNADVSMNISQRQYVASSFLNTAIMPGLWIEYSRGLFVHRLSYKLIYNEIGDLSASYHRLNLAFIRRKVFKNFELSLLCNDILNLRPGIISNTSFNQDFIQTSNFVPIPGQIMLGMKWYFAEKPG